MATLEDQVKATVRSINDYPRKGIVFKDLTTLWKDGELSKKVTDALTERCRKGSPDKIVGVEARGFIVGAPIADRLGIGFVPARKVGKLPGNKVRMDYELEYGKEGLEMHVDALNKGEKVYIVDDLLATGGTAKAAAELVEKMGGKVLGLLFVTELSFLGGRKKLEGYDVYSLAKYERE